MPNNRPIPPGSPKYDPRRDFLDQLVVASRPAPATRKPPLYRALRVGKYDVSIQLPDEDTSPLARPHDAPDWDVTIYDENHRPVTPESHPDLFADATLPWASFWEDDTAISLLPPLVRTLLDLLDVGPEHYYGTTVRQAQPIKEGQDKYDQR
jgi:hypothetical protein